MLHLKLLEKQEQAKPETRRRRDTIKIRDKSNEIREQKSYAKMNETNMIKEPLVNLTEEEGEDPN
jgi:hypothetical protein